MVGGYVRSRIVAQLAAAAPIVLYLLAFQVLVLGRPPASAGAVALGVGMVIVGLAAFLEGLFLALMPAAERCGLGLPRRVHPALILLLAFVLGLLATAAEPAIAVVQRLGSSVTPWDAPLLFVVLGRHSLLLVLVIGAGVGAAIVLGILRSLRGWPLVSFLVPVVLALMAVSFGARHEPNLDLLLSLAWDTGAVTTGPVTVPLVLALGAGISRMSARVSDEGAGFGSIALASLLPVLAVMALGAMLLPGVPAPMSREAFLAGDRATLDRQLFGGREAFSRWAVGNLAPDELAAIRGDGEAAAPATEVAAADPPVGAVLGRSLILAARSVLPLAAALLALLWLVLRQRLAWPDEAALGLVLCVAGMALFSAGLEVGLLRLGAGSGSVLPGLVRARPPGADAVLLERFDPATVLTATGADGRASRFFYLDAPGGPVPVPFVPERHDPVAGTYLHVPAAPRPPGVMGWAAFLLFAFGLGFGVTLVEPALAALGVTLENITVGVFTRRRLVANVAAGVGIGTAAGFAMVAVGIPLAWMLAPLYLVLLGLSLFSTDLFVAIAWDSAGVTTGPLTVPLVLAVGAGIGGSLGTGAGFGILALASGFPILTVLLAGLSLRAGASSAAGGGR